LTLFKKKKLGKTLSTIPRYRPNLEVRKQRQPAKNFRQNTEKKLLRLRSTSKKTKKIIRPLILIGIGLIIYFAGNFLFISDSFKITKIEYNKDTVSVEDENPILNYLENFEGENMFLTDTDTEELYLQETYPEYKTIEIKKSFPHTLTLELELYEIAANLITETEGITRKFIISENGIATQADTEDPSLPYIYIETGSIIMVGRIAIEKEVLDFIMEAITDFENKFGMRILDVTYYETAREVHLHTERYFDVWLDTQLSVDEQFNKLKQALPKLNIYEDDLRYIDLRISGQSGDKVIYMPG